MVDNQFVEAVGASLIREYLSRKGLKATLHTMDEEMPRNEHSINNRVALMKQLHIEKLMKRNKQDDTPLRSMVEVLTKFILEESGLCSAILAKSGSYSKSSHKSPPLAKNDSKCALVADDLVVEDADEGETLAGTGKTFSYAISAVKSNGELPPRKSKQASGTSRILGTSAKNTNQSASAKTTKHSSCKKLSTDYELNSPFSDVKDERGAVPVPSESSLSSLLFDEFSDGHGGKSEFVSDYYHPKDTTASESASNVRLSSAAMLEQLGQTQKTRRPLTGKCKDQANVLTTTKNNPMEEYGLVEVEASRARRGSSVETLKAGELEDVNDSEVSPFDMSALRSLHPTPVSAEMHPIDLNTAMKLKKLILGSENLQFNSEWSRQNLGFCTLPKLQYGIVQKKGGPCGVLAAIQSYVLLEMLFGEEKLNTSKSFEPSPEECRNALAAALSRIFWKAGEQKTAIVALPSSTSHFIGGNKCKPDRLTETLMLYRFSSYTELNSFIEKNIILFEAEGSSGVILALYSTVLCRTVEKVRSEMDEPNGKLMGAYGYCSQELVNLFVTGNAVSNVFNNRMELDSGAEIVTVLKGIQQRSNIGFLSLFEHYDNTKVGTYYKTPRYPIWIVCSESHFTVLYSMNPELLSDWRAERRFDLHYYDGLARQLEPIKLTVDTTNPDFKVPSEKEEMVPPLDMCIRTKWHDAFIDWNSTEPLL